MAPVFHEPTFDDYSNWIDWHISRAHKRAQEAVNLVRGQFAQGGRFQSGARVLNSIDASRKEFEAGVETVLGELKRSIKRTTLDRQELRRITAERLTDFVEKSKAAAHVSGDQGVRGMQKHVIEQFAAFDQYLQFALRQFDVGNLDPVEPEVPPVTNNSINVGTMTGSVIQQGSPGASQSGDFKVNVEAVTAALHDFESELSKQTLDGDKMAAIAADVATVKAQLTKPSPSMTILREAGKSIRNIVEGIAATLITPEFITVTAALGSALGV
jgi:hypothetical protein